MRWRWIALSFATASVMLASTATAAAQSPALYNYERANRHFLNSRYGYRTLYSSVPAAGGVTYTPFSYQNQYVEPSYSKQWIVPQGYQRFDVFPGRGGTVVMPNGFSSYYSPGFNHALFAPVGGPIAEYYYR
jgi:hypothetical protein